jgi:DNA-directed RNA polymerase
MSFLEGIASESPWQFLAAADEYYHCFIKRDRHTTSLRCGMDMSCSGAGLMAGIRRCKTGARLVNVSPTDEPQDLYRACWDALVRLNAKTTPYPLIDPSKLHRLTEQKHGRSIAKAMVMVAQYSAGIQRQMEEFYAIHDDLPEALQLNDEEIKVFRKLWQEALSEVCSFTFVVEWFQARAQEIYDSGKKQIMIPMPNGSTQIMRYPLYKPHNVKSFHHGSISWLTEYLPTDEPDIKKWLSSITANTIHSLDASLLSLGLADFPEAFSTVHDACYTYCGTCMDDMLQRLKEAYVATVSFDIWGEFLKANDLENKPETAAPIVGNLDLNQVLKSDYIFA